ncbi:MAG: hypothetical protein RBU21_12730 [FCB group bacterium]|jgi:hypothetical protein|nr:hypothetical protein [FCB group bacterium]
MRRRHCIQGAIAAVFGLVMAVTAATAEESGLQPNAEASEPIAASAEEAEFEKRWQIFFGAVNLWPKLEESEGKVDKLMNNGLGRLLPRWEEPRTFKDWRDDVMLWEFQMGVSRDINPNWSWYWAFGGVYGYQPNEKRYHPLGIPLKIGVEFERKVLFTSTGIDYYPWGKPELPEGAGHAVMPRLRAAKPYVELFVTYVDLLGRADVTFHLPGIGKFAHYQDKARYDLIGIGPRIGLDIPLTEKDSLSFAVNPILFTSHQDEFDNISIATFVRHRF